MFSLSGHFCLVFIVEIHGVFLFLDHQGFFSFILNPDNAGVFKASHRGCDFLPATLQEGNLIIAPSTQAVLMVEFLPLHYCVLPPGIGGPSLLSEHSCMHFQNNFVPIMLSSGHVLYLVRKAQEI